MPAPCACPQHAPPPLPAPACHPTPGDKLDKERIKALGMGAFASYGFISNLNYGSALGMAWLAFVKRYGVSPMAPGQWPAFLAFYAGNPVQGIFLGPAVALV